jgi:NitT/TauT family transport system substrate-binding protein
MSRETGRRTLRRLGVATAAGAIVALALFGGSAASKPGSAHATEVRVVTLPIANGLPLDVGIKKGFFARQGITVKKTTLQSGNDVVLALANNSGDIGYLGFVPMYIAVTSGIPLTLVSASEVEGTSLSDNWQDILVKGSSSIRGPAGLKGKTIAVNALKGVGEVMIKAAMEKKGVKPNAFRLTALPFPQMRTALNNGQVDAIWTPEPFLSQGVNIDHDRIVMAPGPVLGRFWPIGGYAARSSWESQNPKLAEKFRKAINQALTYSQSHPAEIRAMLPPGTQNVHLPIWSPLVDRTKLQKLAGYAKKYGVITKLPNMKKLVPSSIASGLVLQATATDKLLLLKLDGKAVKTLSAGPDTFVVTDRSKTQNFRLKGPGVNKSTSLKATGRATWTVTLRKGTYRYWSDGRPRVKRVLKVS